jgi:hypothetical protein
MKELKRLDKVQGALTPKQAVSLWMEEAHRYPNLQEYVQFLRGQPEHEAPLSRLPDQVEDAVTESMKGQPKDVIATAVRRAVRDVVFLYHLHNQLNFKVLSEQRAWSALLLALGQMLTNTMRENIFHNVLCNQIQSRLQNEIPYPLDRDTAAAVEAAISHHVTSREEIEDQLRVWLEDYLLAHGAKTLPEYSYDYQDEQLRPTVTPDNEKEVRVCFVDDTQFERFKTGEDYHHGLAGVADAAYNAHYDRVVLELKKLADSGEVKTGASAWLETVPMSFLREAPLIEGEWIDRFVLELAEWGALLRSSGYEPHETKNDHPLASDAFFEGDGTPVSQGRLQALRRKAARQLKRFPARTRQIERRSYVHFEDYCRWQGRNVPGDLLEEVESGIITDSWNRWLGQQKGATMGGILVERLAGRVKEGSCCLSANAVKAQTQRQQRILSRIEPFESRNPLQIQTASLFHQTAESFLGELYEFREVVTSISQRYFDGSELLFHDLGQSLSELIEDGEKLVRKFNALAGNEGESESIELGRIQETAVQVIAGESSYHLAIAKAETLVFMGQRRAALELVERYL